MSFELVLDLRCALGESPSWSAERQELAFVDIKGRRLHRFRPVAGEHDSVELPEEFGCVAWMKGGGFVGGARSGIWTLDESGRPGRMLAANPEDQATSRFNDGRPSPDGRFWVGTMDETKGGSAALYRYDRRGLARQFGGLNTSNGLAFSPDGRTLYHSDTPRFTVRAYPYDPTTGEIGEGRDFARLDLEASGEARPDGGAMDAEGCYWSALWEGGRVQRRSPKGELLAEYEVPSRCVTMPAFGGDDFRTLYVTTARDGRPEEELTRLPHSGGLFAMRVDVPGLREPAFDPEA